MNMRKKWRGGKVRAFLLIALVLLISGLALAETYPAVTRVSYDKMAAAGKEPRLTKLRLDPVKGWINSGVFLKKGDLVNITADGRIDPGVRFSRGPDGYGRDPLKEYTHDCKYMELIGRLGDGQPICVGSNSTFEVLEGGQLSFRVNELDSLRLDDLGYFDIQVRVIEAAATGATPAPGALPVTAVLDLVPVNLTVDEVRVLSTALRAHLAATGKYTIIDQTQVSQAVFRLKIPATDLAGPQAALRVARELGADQVVFGQVGRIGNGYSVTLQRASVKTGAVENTVVDTYTCSAAELPGRMAESARKL